MPCFHPFNAWRATDGTVTLKELPESTQPMQVACGHCIGCRQSRAAAWTLRAKLEMQQHSSAVFTTLTYNNDNCPPQLHYADFQSWLKRLRERLRPTTARPIRFFACGEYGEQRGRPHYHAILYGVDQSSDQLIEETWGLGNTRTRTADDASLGYTAGYTAKKLCTRREISYVEKVDAETGEFLGYERRITTLQRDRFTDELVAVTAPFLKMSRRPGIGGHARHWPESWREFAIYNGHKVSVPRYLHEAWKANSTPQDIEQLAQEKHDLLTRYRRTTAQRIAGEKIAIARHELSRQSRKLH